MREHMTFLTCQMYLTLKEQQVRIHFLNVQKCFMNKNRYKKNISNKCTSFFCLASIFNKIQIHFFALKYVYIQSKENMQITR